MPLVRGEKPDGADGKNEGSDDEGSNHPDEARDGLAPLGLVPTGRLVRRSSTEFRLGTLAARLHRNPSAGPAVAEVPWWQAGLGANAITAASAKQKKEGHHQRSFTNAAAVPDSKDSEAPATNPPLFRHRSTGTTMRQSGSFNRVAADSEPGPGTPPKPGQPRKPRRNRLIAFRRQFQAGVIRVASANTLISNASGTSAATGAEAVPSSGLAAKSSATDLQVQQREVAQQVFLAEQAGIRAAARFAESPVEVPSAGPLAPTVPSQQVAPGSAEEAGGSQQPKFIRRLLDTVDAGLADPATAFQAESDEEFLALDYIPVTCARPVDLQDKLRVVRTGRVIRLMVAVTCYNEDGDELRRTLRGLARNLPELQDSEMLSWMEIHVLIVLDGRSKANPDLLKYLEEDLKLFEPRFLRKKRRGRPVTMHLFERTVAVRDDDGTFMTPMQMTLALKERNGGKLNSHLWVMSAFGRQVWPKQLLLIDVGTEPSPVAVRRLYGMMEANPKYGGVCGTITVRQRNKWWRPIIGGQMFEYRSSHNLDKALEHLTGFIQVLPGAFSMFRWQALQGAPLTAYFNNEERPLREIGPFTANRFLAEDRTLCLELLAKDDSDWILGWDAGAEAETDVPETLIDLIKQRRRWSNGSFFSLLNYLVEFPRVLCRTRHSIWRLTILMSQWLLLAGQFVISWFLVGSLFLTFLLIIFSALQYGKESGYLVGFRFSLLFAYVCMLVVLLVIGLAGKVGDLKGTYTASMVIFGVLMYSSLTAAGVSFEQLAYSWWLLISSGATGIIYFGSALINGVLLEHLFTFPAFLFLLPTFVTTFQLFSFANLHDISWGTRPGNAEALQRRAYEHRADAAIRRAKAMNHEIKKLAKHTRKTAKRRAKKAAKDTLKRMQSFKSVAATGLLTARFAASRTLTDDQSPPPSTASVLTSISRAPGRMSSAAPGPAAAAAAPPPAMRSASGPMDDAAAGSSGEGMRRLHSVATMGSGHHAPLSARAKTPQNASMLDMRRAVDSMVADRLRNIRMAAKTNDAVYSAAMHRPIIPASGPRVRARGRRMSLTEAIEQVAEDSDSSYSSYSDSDSDSDDGSVGEPGFLRLGGEDSPPPPVEPDMGPAVRRLRSEWQVEASMGSASSQDGAHLLRVESDQLVDASGAAGLWAGDSRAEEALREAEAVAAAEEAEALEAGEEPVSPSGQPGERRRSMAAVFGGIFRGDADTGIYASTPHAGSRDSRRHITPHASSGNSKPSPDAEGEGTKSSAGRAPAVVARVGGGNSSVDTSDDEEGGDPFAQGSPVTLMRGPVATSSPRSAVALAVASGAEDENNPLQLARSSVSPESDADGLNEAGSRTARDVIVVEDADAAKPPAVEAASAAEEPLDAAAKRPSDGDACPGVTMDQLAASPSLSASDDEVGGEVDGEVVSDATDSSDEEGEEGEEEESGEPAGQEGGPEEKLEIVDNAGELDPADMELIQDLELLEEAEARRKVHEQAALRNQELARQHDLDKHATEKAFNAFRMKFILAWLLSNAIMAGVILYNSLLEQFALFVAVAIIITGGTKLAGSCCYRLSVWGESLFHRCCRPTCYYVDHSSGKYICCCYPRTYYMGDVAWANTLRRRRPLRPDMEATLPRFHPDKRTLRILRRQHKRKLAKIHRLQQRAERVAARQAQRDARLAKLSRDATKSAPLPSTTVSSGSKPSGTMRSESLPVPDSPGLRLRQGSTAPPPPLSLGASSGAVPQAGDTPPTSGGSPPMESSSPPLNFQMGSRSIMSIGGGAPTPAVGASGAASKREQRRNAQRSRLARMVAATPSSRHMSLGSSPRGEEDVLGSPELGAAPPPVRATSRRTSLTLADIEADSSPEGRSMRGSVRSIAALMSMANSQALPFSPEVNVSGFQGSSVFGGGPGSTPAGRPPFLRHRRASDPFMERVEEGANEDDDDSQVPADTAGSHSML